MGERVLTEFDLELAESQRRGYSSGRRRQREQYWRAEPPGEQFGVAAERRCVHLMPGLDGVDYISIQYSWFGSTRLELDNIQTHNLWKEICAKTPTDRFLYLRQKHPHLIRSD